ncbi:hypothetical protein BDQ12DRAFT_690782, partial [Crucibulum laeve]
MDKRLSLGQVTAQCCGYYRPRPHSPPHCIPPANRHAHQPLQPQDIQSIHDVRTLDTRTWYPINLRRWNPANRGILHSRADTAPLPHEL